jgi:CubicO group peptidase (beta-lactamase class C family)
MTSRSWATSVLLTCALLGSSAAIAADPPGALDVAEIDRLIEKSVRERHLVGLSVGVMHQGRIVLAKGYGVRSLETGEPVTPDTLFAAGSVTKQLTCAAALLLAQEGKLALDDRVAKYEPGLTRAADVTLLDLGQHVSGYRDYYPLDFVDRPMAKPRPPDEIIQDFARRPLDFEPGTRWSYSNTGYLILGRVVERVSGEPFGSYLDRKILQPLGLHHTRYEPRRDDPALAEGYTGFGLGTPQPAVDEGDGWLAMAAALWSTPTDLLAWDLALMDRKVLSESSWRTMITPGRLADGRSTHYGCGQSVRDQDAALVLTHEGIVAGFNAWNAIVPSTRSAVVLLANADFGVSRPLREAILAKLLPQENEEVPAIQGSPAKEAALELLRQLREGKVDRATLGEEYSAWLTPERIASALPDQGDVSEMEVVGRHERGGMEVAALRFKIGTVQAAGLLYRTPDGKIQEFLFYRREVQ